MITMCAEAQADMLITTRLHRETLPKEKLLICSALRVLAITHHLFTLNRSLSPNSQSWSFVADYLKPTDLPGARNPVINVSRGKANASTLLAIDGELSLMIQDIVKTTQRLIFLRRPYDWPTIFCALYLLKLIQLDLFPFSPWTDTFDGSVRALEDVWESLCGLFAYCAEPHHPLDPNFNLDAYIRMVGPSHPVAVEIYEVLQMAWTESSI